MKELPSTSQFIKKYGLDAKKSLGQNFILDKNFTDKIAKTAISEGKDDLSGEVILEVGPGPASLTRSILDLNPKKLVVIEKDRRCLKILEELQSFYGAEKLQIINEDALKIDELEILQLADQEKFKIIANLPYNIGTLLIIRWIKICKHISSMTLMLQKEVAQRIAAKVNEEHYGRLAIMMQNFAETKIVFDVAKSVFTPPPKVTSAIINIKPRSQPLFDIDEKKLQNVTALAFNQRRKMIKKSLKGLSDDIIKNLEQLDIDPTARPENLTISDFCNLAKLIK